MTTLLQYAIAILDRLPPAEQDEYAIRLLADLTLPVVRAATGAPSRPAAPRQAPTPPARAMTPRTRLAAA